MPERNENDKSTIFLTSKDEENGTGKSKDKKQVYSHQNGYATYIDHDEFESPSPNDNNSLNHSRRHLASTISLCLSVLAHSYLLVSVFPYSGFMAIDLIPAADSENAGSYAGLLASSFMLGRVASSYGWGKVADIYGRKPVLLASLAMSMVWTLLFGLSQTYAIAMAVRFLLGLSNGIVVTAKTLVSELAKGNETMESRGTALVLGMWGYGFLISPAISGALAEPVKQYPNSWIVRQSSFFESFLSKFPFLLPNIAGALFCAVAYAAVYYVIEETLPVDKCRSSTYILGDVWAWIRSRCRCVVSFSRQLNNHETLPLRAEELATKAAEGKNEIITTDECPCSISNDWDQEDIKEIRLRHNESCIMLSTNTSPIRASSLAPTRIIKPSITAHEHQQKENKEEEIGATMSSLWARKNTRAHLIGYWLYSFVATSFDEAFPLFCLSQEGGLGLAESSIGKILSSSGLIFVACQYFLLTAIVDRFGLYASIRAGMTVSSPLIMLVPVSIIFNSSSASVASDRHMTRTTLLFLSIVMGLNRIFSSIFFSGITIATNRSVPSSHRATMNGLSMLGGSVAKAVGPTFAGLLVSFSLSSGMFVDPHLGSFFIFFLLGSMGIAVTAFIFQLKEQDDY